MTVSRFDPRALTQYDKPPPLLHLEFGQDGRVYRYVMVEAFAPGVLDEDTRRTALERVTLESHESIRAGILENRPRVTAIRQVGEPS